MPRVNHPNASTALDLLRGSSALAVVVGHERGLFFQDYHDLQAPSAILKALYLVTSLGHQAVVVFFVLSGFFIGASVMQALARGSWSWRTYLINRLSRLYVVLIPALLLGLAWDHLGIALLGTAGVYGGTAPTSGIIDWFVPERLGIVTLLGNVAFLQTIFVPSLGSNGPLWSLANEFWYYMLFPLLLLALASPSPRRARLGAAAAAALILALVGLDIAAYFLLWLMGTAVYRAPPSPLLAGRGRATIAAGAVTLIFATTLAFCRVHQDVSVLDLAVGAATSLLVYTLLHLHGPGAMPLYAWIARTLAGFSYTLYVVHLPALVLVRALVIPKTRWLPDARHLLLAACVGAGVLGYAYLISRLTEARTDRLRLYLLPRARPAAPLQQADGQAEPAPDPAASLR